MYHKAAIAGGLTTVGSALPLNLNLIWWTVGAFALLMAAQALWRIIPKHTRRDGTVDPGR